MQKVFPFLSAFNKYAFSDFKGDLVAGLTVGVMLIPQGMAYAMIAGLPPVYGLYAGIFPPILYALFGSSRQLAVGPAAMDSMLVATSVSSLAIVGTENYISIVIFLAAMVGLMQLVMGLLRLGFAINFVSIPVINGFIFAVALTIGYSQLHQLLGLELKSDQYFVESLVNMDSINITTLILGLVSVIIILSLKKINKNIPGGLVVLVLGIAVSYFFALDEVGVKIVGEVPQGLPNFEVPTIDLSLIRALLPIALTLSMVGFLEAFSIGKTIQRNHRKEYEIIPNRELVGLGMGNFVGSFFGTFPTTGGLSRSVVSDDAGAKSIVATAFSVILVVLTLIFFTPFFYHLPKAALSAIIMVAVLGLIDIKKVQSLWVTDRSDFYLLLTTFIGTLVFGIELGIVIGVLLSILVLIYKTSDPHMAWLGKVNGTEHYRNLARYPTTIDHPELAILRFDARLYYANVAALKGKVGEMICTKGNLKLFILDAQSISDIDSTGLEGLNDIYDLLQDADITFAMVSVIGPVRDKLKVSGFVEKAGADHFYPSISCAIEGKSSEIQFQTNI